MDEKDFLMKLGKKIDKLIDKEFEKVGLDRAYYDFFVSTTTLSIDFKVKPINNIIILDDRKKHVCAFCRKPTNYYDNNLQTYVCPICLSRMAIERVQRA